MINPHQGGPGRVVRGRPKAAPSWAGHRRPGLTPSPARQANHAAAHGLLVGHRPFHCTTNGWAGPGTTQTGASRPHIESPMQGVVRLETVPRSARSRIPCTRADQKTCSAEHTLPRISLGLGAQPNTHRDRRGPRQLAGGVLRPSTRPPRPRPMRTGGPGRDGLWAISLHFMNEQTWLSSRFDSDITCACSALEIRVEIGQNPRPRTPLQTRCKRQSRSQERWQIDA